VPPAWLPAPGQASIAIEACRANTAVVSMLAALDDPGTRITVTAERAMNRALGGSCSIPIGAWCTRSGDALQLQGVVGDPASGRILRAEASMPASQPDVLGQRVAELLLAQGGGAFLGI
jgi:hydroxymethylbilane synthase